MAAGLVTAMSWGATGVWVRLLPPVSPLVITAARLVIAALFLSVLERVRPSKAERSRRASAYLLGSLLVGYYSLAVAAFQLAPIAEVALCISSSPLLVLLWNAIRERSVRAREIVAVSLGICGLALVLRPWTPVSAQHGRALGLTCAGLAAVATTAYVLVNRALGIRRSTWGQAPSGSEVARHTFLPAALIISLIDLARGTSLSEARSLVSVGPAAAMLALGVVSTALPTWSFALATQRIPPLLATTLRLTTPVFAAIFATTLLDEPLAPSSLRGGMLVLCACALLLTGEQSPRTRASRAQGVNTSR